MQCSTCGTTIPSNRVTCPACGASAPLSATSGYDAISYDDTVTPYLSYAPPPTPAHPSAPLPRTGATAAPLSETEATSPAGMALFPEQPQMSKRTILTSTLVMLLALAALLVISSSGVAAYATIYHPAELNAQATAVTRQILVREASATSVAIANSPQNIYDRVTQTKPLFSDPLNSPVNNLWATSIKGGNGCGFSNGAYHIYLAQGTFAVSCSNPGSPLNNFVFQIQATIIQGYEAGIVFRTPTEAAEGYQFYITYTGLYSLAVITGSQQAHILGFGRSTAIKTGFNQPNLLAVMARGSTISLFINRQFVFGVQDQSYASGGIAIFAGNTTIHTADAAFNNEQVWSLP